MHPVIVKVQMSTSPRQRMIQSAAVLMRERGVEATSFSEVLARSGAPRGSIYHHFPGGKAQLIEEATRYAGEFTASGLAAALAQDDPVAAVVAFTSGWNQILRKTEFAGGCPVVAASLEGERLPGARDAAAAAFESWELLLSAALAPHVGSPRRAQSLATLVIASIEGAVVLARAQRCTAPLERVAAEVQELIVAAIDARDPVPKPRAGARSA
jgi:TetR/AcrR family transcriptional regulator, lmrAB and yxaGH operons repressor